MYSTLSTTVNRVLQYMYHNSYFANFPMAYIVSHATENWLDCFCMLYVSGRYISSCDGFLYLSTVTASRTLLHLLLVIIYEWTTYNYRRLATNSIMVYHQKPMAYGTILHLKHCQVCIHTCIYSPVLTSLHLASYNLK